MKKLKKISLWIFCILIVALLASIMVSPYGKAKGFPYKLIKHTVEINAPADSVFRFLGNSNNAKRWSVFVHHITTLNADSIKDGKPGSRRRCFCKENESGIVWDETVTEVIPNTKRQIICYNMKEFSMTVPAIATEQIYEAVSDSSCKLTFTFFEKNYEPNLWESLKLHLGSFRLHNIFRKNLENVKAICEGKKAVHERE